MLPWIWTKANASASTGNCVEARRTESGVQLRDSKDPNGPILTFTFPEWDAFVDGVQAGEFTVRR